MSFIINSDTPNGSNAPVGKDIHEKDFMQEVIEPSASKLVLVDFWAPWCGPCKSFTPILEKTVASYNGRVLLVKINIDESQMIASQLGVKSVPAVFAFQNGQPVNGFMGAQPEGKLKQFIDHLLQNDPETAAIEQAEEQAFMALSQGNTEIAQSVFEQIIQQFPDRMKAKIGLAKCYLAANQFENAKNIILALPQNEQSKPEAKQILTLIALYTEYPDQPNLSDIDQKTIESAKSDSKSLETYALALFKAGQMHEAIELILEFIRAISDDDHKDQARLFLLKLFDSFDVTDKDILQYRRKLSSILFS